MPVTIDYTAKRSIKAGHVLDVSYQISLSVSRQDRGYRPDGKRNVSISGNTVDVINRRDIVYSFTSGIIDDGPYTEPLVDNATMQEFLDSTATGETFQMDVTGTTEFFIMDNFKRPYSVRRIGNTNLFRYSFTAREL